MYTGIFYHRPTNTIHLWDDKLGYKKFPYKPYCYFITNENPDSTSIYGDGLKKMLFNSINEMREFKESWDEKVFESDLRPELRTLVDLYHKCSPSLPEVTTAFVDIEVDIEDPQFKKLGGFPNASEANAPINAITLYLTSTEKFHTWVLLQDEMNNPDYNRNDSFIYTFKDERELLSNYINFFKSQDIRCYSGWNSESFDVPYIFNRITKLLGKSYTSHLSPIDIVKNNPEREEYQIAGIAHMDYMFLYKKFTVNEKDNYKLDNIAAIEIDSHKVKYEGALGSLYRKDINKFIEYNIGDVELLVKLDKKLQYIDLARTLCYKGNIPFESIVYSSLPIDGAILTYLKKHNLVAPDGKHNAREGHIQGAYVATPTAGLYEYVVDLDYTSLYPSIMRTLNISPETRVKKVRNNEIALLEGLEDNQVVSINGCVYDNSKRGVIPTILDLWFDERVEYKNKMKEYKKLAQNSKDQNEKNDFLSKANHYNLLQYTLKILLNTVYGVHALPSFRFFNRDDAEAITLTGQAAIKYARKEVDILLKKLGSTDRVTYADTDSLMLSCKGLLNKFNADLNDIPKCVDLIRNKLMPAFRANNVIALTEFALKSLNVRERHYFHLKQEFIARRMFFLSAKKRYAMWLVNKEGIDCDKIEFKGLDIRRSSFPPYFKKTMFDCCEGILKGKEQQNIQDVICDYRRQTKNQSLFDIATPTGVKKLSPLGIKGQPVHVRAAQVYNKMLIDEKRKNAFPITAGSKLKWVYLEASNPWNQNVIAFNEETPKDILDNINRYVDYETIIAKNIEGKMGPILQACGMQMPEKVNEKFEGFFSF